MSRTIHLDAPNIGEGEKRWLNRAVESGYVSTAGPFVPNFEERCARYLGVPRAVSTQSGTAALHAALHELGIGPGDEVIVPALSFIASVNPIAYVGARPVFADIDERTWNIDPAAVERKITKRTKAVIPVHLYGNPCDMDRIMDCAAAHRLYVVEDAAESLGARYRGRFTGAFGDLGCFSFNGNKIVTTGGGGMVVGSDPKRMEHLKFLVNQARDEEKGYYHPEIGFNYRMTNIEAALGLAQLERLEEFLEKKRSFNRLYRAALDGIDGLRFQEPYEGAESSWWLTCVTFERPVDIPALQETLRERGVPTRRLFMPATAFPPYLEYDQGDLDMTCRIYERSLCLPGSTLNSEDDIRFVCAALREVLV